MYLYVSILFMNIYIYIQGGTELFPRQNFNPRIDASHTILTYSLDCQKRHEGKYKATFLLTILRLAIWSRFQDMTLKIG